MFRTERARATLALSAAAVILLGAAAHAQDVKYPAKKVDFIRSEEHTSELQSH